MMLETTATRLSASRGPHFAAGQGSCGQAARARGRGPQQRPVDDGHPHRHRETLADGPIDLRDQEGRAGVRRDQGTIVCRSGKPDTKMRDEPTPNRRPGRDDRRDPVILAPRPAPGAAGPGRRPAREILGAGIDDWGRVSLLTPDADVQPERPWPDIDELAARTAKAGLHAARAPDDLPAANTPSCGCIPEWPGTWPRWPTRPTGLAADGATPRGLPWQEPDGGGPKRRRLAMTCT